MVSKDSGADGWLALARNSICDTMRDSRSSSSVQDSSTCLYCAGGLSLDKVTWALPIKLFMGERSSCARSSQNRASC